MKNKLVITSCNRKEHVTILGTTRNLKLKTSFNPFSQKNFIKGLETRYDLRSIHSECKKSYIVLNIRQVPYQTFIEELTMLCKELIEDKQDNDKD